MSGPTDSDKAIRDTVKRVMHKEGLTQAALAERLGVKQPSVADILSGRRGRQPESLLNLLDALGLELTVTPKAPTATTPEPPAYLALAGRFDDPDSPGDVSARHDHYIGEGLETEYTESTAGKR